MAGVRGDFAHDVIFGHSELFVGAFAGARAVRGGWQFQASAELGEHFLWGIGDGLFFSYDTYHSYDT